MCKLTVFSSGCFCQIFRVTDEALIAETMVWTNFFLMNVFFALKGSKLFIIIIIIIMPYLNSEQQKRLSAWASSQLKCPPLLLTCIQNTHRLATGLQIRVSRIRVFMLFQHRTTKARFSLRRFAAVMHLFCSQTQNTGPLMMRLSYLLRSLYFFSVARIMKLATYLATRTFESSTISLSANESV